MNQYLSTKIKNISFISIIMVVFLHCYNFADNFLQPTTIITEGLNYATFIEYFICNGFTRVAVPLFFLISGYLFYHTFKCSFRGYGSKLKSRFFSLVVPYVLWTVMSMLVCRIFWNVDIMPVNDLKGNLELGGMVFAFLMPPNFQFWFVFQLILYVIIAPVIYLLIKCKFTRPVYLIGLFVVWCMNIAAIKIINVEGILFFSMGAWLAITGKEELISKKVSKTFALSTFGAWIVLLVVKTILCGIRHEGDATLDILILYKVSELIGIVTTWYSVDYVVNCEDKNSKIYKLSCHTFFIYCFHEPLLDFVIQYTLNHVSNATPVNLITYFVYPTVTILLAIGVSKALLRFVPVVHNILTGSRGSRNS